MQIELYILLTYCASVVGFCTKYIFVPNAGKKILKLCWIQYTGVGW